jgi:dTDP-4-amino-4,6-dideoxygalactose transaminase
MDPEDLKKKIQDASRPIAVVIPVHFGGMPSDMRSIINICNSYDIHLMDDAAHICGGRYNGKKIGSICEMTCFSFHPVKNLSMPTGGAITLNSEAFETAKKMLDSKRWCGIDNRIGPHYDVTSISPNYYMNEISAAIGLVQLTKLDRLNKRRSEIARKYCSKINLEWKMKYDNDCVYHLFWVIIENRDRFIEYMQKKGIEIGAHYRPIHTMSIYQEINKSELSVTEEVGKKIATLPIHPNLNDDQVDFVIEAVNSYK